MVLFNKKDGYLLNLFNMNLLFEVTSRKVSFVLRKQRKTGSE